MSVPQSSLPGCVLENKAQRDEICNILKCFQPSLPLIFDLGPHLTKISGSDTAYWQSVNET